MPDAVVLALDGLPRDVVDHVGELCRRHGVPALAATAVGPATAECRAVVAALPAGARAIPEIALGLSERLGARLVLLSPEPLRRPVTRLLGGAVTVIGVPLVPEAFVDAVLRGAAPPPAVAGGAAFETLQRSWWLAWHPGAEAGCTYDVHRSDDGALTAVIRLGADLDLRAADVADELDAVATDGRREAHLWERAGVDAAIIRITASADEWLLYWPCHEHELAMWSPHRLPTRWPMHTALEHARRRMLRVPAYPGDLLIATIAAEPAGAQVEGRARLAGGPDAVADFLAAARPDRSGLFVEVR